MMSFTLKNAHVILSRLVVNAFRDFTHKFSSCLHGWLDRLWVGKIPYFKPSIDVGKVSTTSNFTKSEEMYILRTIWNPIGTHCMQGRQVGRSCQDCDNHRPTETNDNKTTKGNIGQHRVLPDIYKGICSDHCTNGEIIEERCEVRME